MMRVRAFLAFPVAVVAVAACLRAQAPDAQPSFEVASIKANHSGELASRGGTEPGGRWSVTNVTLLQLMNAAYRVTASQIAGGPAWLTSDRFDISAKMPEGSFDAQTGVTPNSAVPPMLRSLLEERFHLSVHHEPRDVSVVAITLARSDGRLGPGLVTASAADTDCAARTTPDFAASDPFKTVGPCSTMFGSVPSKPGVRRMLARGRTMDELAATAQASLAVNPIVRNETHLTGPFNINLEYVPQLSAQGPSVPSTDDGPSIYTAFEEQLGLKLVSHKESTDVIVIDHAEHPTEN